jgi:hypothetical protein
MPRHEFLYDITFWEAKRIIRGRRQRNILKYQLMRMNIWASMFCMGNPRNVKPDELFKLYFDDDDEMNDAGITDEEAQQMLEDLNAINRQLRNKRESSEA